MSFETLREICRAVSIPVVAIGGITGENLGALRGSGIAGIAVVSAIFAREDTGQAAGSLRGKSTGNSAGIAAFHIRGGQQDEDIRANSKGNYF